MDAMRQASKALKPPATHLLSLRLLWPFLILLAAFVFFFEFIVDAGGSGGPRSFPAENPSPLASPTPTAGPFPDTSSLPLANVVQVIDGHTLAVRLDRETLRLRYSGAEAPGPGERCFDEAKEVNSQLVDGRAVRLLADKRDANEADLPLRYVFLEDGRSVEALLLTHGLALARREGGAYQEYFIRLEKEAKADQVGCLWSH